MVALMPWIGMAIGAGLVGVSVWGFRFCVAVTRSVAVPSTTNANHSVDVLMWFVLFAPVALLGVFFLGAALKQVWTSISKSRTQKRVEIVILPPQPAGPASPRGHEGEYQEPLDDATVGRLNELGDRLAKIVNMGAGLLFLLFGLAGFVVLGISSHRWVAPFSLVIRLLVASGFFVLIGAAILRHGFKEFDTAWLIPLKVFTSIVSRRVSSEEVARRNRSSAAMEESGRLVNTTEERSEKD